MKPYIKNKVDYPYTEITNDIRVSVKTNFLDDQSDEENNIWVWSYHILIENNGADIIQLTDRYWKITDASGHIQEVNGSGVIGLKPTIKPGDFFEYSSGTPLKKSSGFMTGHYKIVNHKKEIFYIKIPIFSLDKPFKNKTLN